MAVISEKFDRLGQEDPSRSYKLGIMGGTFDPIHIGHLACAEQVRENINLDGVVFVPAGNPVFKREKKVTPAEQRLEMCHLACMNNPYFDVSALEIEREGDTYTVDTLRTLRAHYPENVELFFITGADAVMSILKWHQSAEIAQLTHLIAATRPGYARLEDLQRYMNSSDFRVDYAEITALSISSSDLRLMVAEGRSIRYLTMQSVYDYIDSHSLYKEIG